MKKVTVAILFGVVMAFTFSALADEVTLKGTAVCKKCNLKTSAKCANALLVKIDGDEVIYQLAGKADMSWHNNLCKKAIKVKMTGTVSEKDGKKVFTVTDIKSL